MYLLSIFVKALFKKGYVGASPYASLGLGRSSSSRTCCKVGWVVGLLGHDRGLQRSKDSLFGSLGTY